MAHNDWVRPSGQFLGYFAPSARDLRMIDQQTVENINGDGGGTYNPTTPIVIGGSGMAITGAASEIDGAITQNGGRLQLGDNDFPVFLAARSRSICIPLLGLSQNAGALGGTITTATFGITGINVYGGTWTFGLPEYRLHNGMTLTQIDMRFRVTIARSAVPAQLPGFRVQRIAVNRSGAIAQLLSTGYKFLPTPASGAAYYNGGAVQIISMVPDGNNVIDTGTYTYQLGIIDESGANALAQPTGNIFHSLTLTYASIPDMRFP